MGFDVLYKQTVTLFNRVKGQNDEVIWKPTVLHKVHLIQNKGAVWDNQGGRVQDNATLHVRYEISDGDIIVDGKRYYPPKKYQESFGSDDCFTFQYGNNNDFDFFVEGEVDVPGTVSESDYGRHGFYSYANKKYDNVYAITSVSKFNLIPHFEITAR